MSFSFISWKLLEKIILIILNRLKEIWFDFMKVTLEFIEILAEKLNLSLF